MIISDGQAGEEEEEINGGNGVEPVINAPAAIITRRYYF
jgi:hypothetical protein